MWLGVPIVRFFYDRQINMARNCFTVKSHLNLLIIAFISSLVLIIYSRTVLYGFVYIDDLQFVVNNPYLSQGFSKANLIWAFTSSTDISKYYIPVTWLSLILDYYLYGLHPGGFHFTNLLLHLSNSVLLFISLLKFTNRPYLCTIVACLFAVHPLHVESVAWISERKDVLSTFFFLLTILSYYYYTRRPGIKTYALVMFFFLMGILSKPMLVTLPFVLLLLDLWPSNRICFDLSLQSQKSIILKLLGEKIPFFIIIFVLSVMAYITQKKGHAITPFDLYPLWMRVENMFVAYWVYLKKMVWPTDLAVHYPYPGQMSYWIIAISCFMFLIVCFYSVKSIKRVPFVAVGWYWFVITLFPVAGIIIIGPYLIADRYAYISLIGIYMVVAWGINELIKKFPDLKTVVSGVCICVLLVLTFLSWHQVAYWENSETLFKRALMVDPDNSVAHHNLATYYDHNKQYLKAVRHYEAAIRISPTYVEAYANLGNTCFKLQDYNKAVKNYLEATALNPKHAVANNNLGIAYRYLNDFENGIKAFENALKIDPDYSSAKENLKLILIEKRDHDKNND